MKYTIEVILSVDDDGTMERVPKKLRLRASASGAQEAVEVADALLCLAIAEGCAGAGARVRSERGLIYDVCRCPRVLNEPKKGDKGYYPWVGLLQADASNRKFLLSRKPRAAKAAKPARSTLTAQGGQPSEPKQSA